jgi:hypothetical protein
LVAHVAVGKGSRLIEYDNPVHSPTYSAVAGLYLHVAVFPIASMASVSPISGVVLTLLHAQPPAIAMAKAAALTLSGMSITPTTS